LSNALRDSQRQLQQAERIASLGYWEAEVESGQFSVSEGGTFRSLFIMG
jgi:hypothetical protein